MGQRFLTNDVAVVSLPLLLSVWNCGSGYLGESERLQWRLVFSKGVGLF